MSDSTSLKSVSNIGDYLLSDQIETNLLSFFQWGLLGIGNWFNVRIPTSGVYGGSQHVLRLSEDPNYLSGQVWEAFRKDWVWETGVAYTSQPIAISGVNVNGSFYPTASTTGAYAHRIDYPNGRVLFANAISTSGKVTCEYSYRYWQWYTADTPWWKQFQMNSFRVDNQQFLQQGSGAWSVLAQNRVQLPAVIVEATSDTDRFGFELGNETATISQDVKFHILSETPYEKKTMHDIITSQWPKRFVLFDKNRLFSANAFPLDDGTPVSGFLTYPSIVRGTGVGGFAWLQLRTKKMRGIDVPFHITAPLYQATVRGTFEIDMP